MTLQRARDKAGPVTYIAILGLTAMILGCFGSVKGQLLCKLIGDTFVSGYSAAKGVTFLGFVLLVCCSRLVRLPSPPRLPAMVTAGLAACITLSLVEHALYCYAVDLPLTQASWLCVGGEYCFNGLLHLHVSKMPIAWLTNYRGDWMDSGDPFLSIFPNWLAALHLVVFVVASFALLLLMRRWSFERPPGYFLTSLLASVGVFKCAIDGGPLEAEFLIPLAPLLYALWGRRVALAYLPFLFLLLTFRLSVPEQGRLTVEYFHMATMVLVLSLPALVQRLYLGHRGLALATGILGFVLLGRLLVWESDTAESLFQVPRAINLYRYGQTIVNPGIIFNLVVSAEIPSVSPDLVLAGHYRGVKLHLYEGRVTRPMTNFEICDETGANLLRRPISLSRSAVRSTLRGVLFNDWPKDWPQSEMVLGYRCRGKGREVEIQLDMRPGSDLNVYRDALPGNLFVVLEARTSLAPPELAPMPGKLDPSLPRGHLRWLPGLR